MSVKNIRFDFRLSEELAIDMKKVMKIMGYDNISKFIRNTIITMVKHAKEENHI